jgi:predicted 3-demethylubiquinone-9 3-methyltransferase (glyoxalase superfamily)
MSAAKNRVCLWFDGGIAEAAARVQQAMMPMQKIDVAAIEAAAKGDQS